MLQIWDPLWATIRFIMPLVTMLVETLHEIKFGTGQRSSYPERIILKLFWPPGKDNVHVIQRNFNVIFVKCPVDELDAINFHLKLRDCVAKSILTCDNSINFEVDISLVSVDIGLWRFRSTVQFLFVRYTSNRCEACNSSSKAKHRMLRICTWIFRSSR